MSDIFGKRGRDYLTKLKLEDAAQELLRQDLELLETIAAEVRAIEKWLHQATLGDQRVELLRTIPLVRRFFSAVSMATNWLRRIASASSAWACSSFSGLTEGLTASPKRDSTWASSRSVLASRPVARANSLTCLRIDHCDRNSSGPQRAGHWHFQTAGGFKDHQVGSRCEPLLEPLDSMLIVGNREGHLIGTEGDVQLGLGYIDSDNRFISAITVPLHAACPALRSVFLIPYNRSGLSVVGARRPSLLDGVHCPRIYRSAAPRPLMTLLHPLHTRIRSRGSNQLPHVARQRREG